MITIALIDEGRVDFSRQLVADFPRRFPEFADVELSTHGVDPERPVVADGTTRRLGGQPATCAMARASRDRREVPADAGPSSSPLVQSTGGAS